MKIINLQNAVFSLTNEDDSFPVLELALNHLIKSLHNNRNLPTPSKQNVRLLSIFEKKTCKINY